MPPARGDIAHYVSTAFIGGGADRSDMIALAKVRSAPPDVLAALQSLPDRRFGHLFEVWDHLPAGQTRTPMASAA